MADNETPYTRLPGIARGPSDLSSTYYSLWLGPDHLLSIVREGFSENYKRFYYRDIQTIVLRRTAASLLISFVNGFFTLGFLALTLLGVFRDWPVGASATFAGFGIFFLVLLAINLVRGTSCECTLRTAVQSERLRSLSRFRVALKAIRRIREAVEAVQGPLDAAAYNLLPLSAPGTAAAASYPGASRPRAPRAEAVALRSYNGWAHFILFVLFIVDFFDTVSEFQVQDGFISGNGGLLLLVAVFTSLILALVLQERRDFDRKLRIITWLSLAYVCVSLVAAIGMAIVVYVRNPNALAVEQALRPLASVEGLLLALFAVAGSGLLGTLGLISVFRYRNSQSTPPPLPVPEETPGNSTAEQEKTQE